MSKDEVEIKSISFSKLVPKEDFDLEILNEKLLGKSFAITAIRFGESQFGVYAVVTTDKGIFRVSSGVLIAQLKLIEKQLVKGYDEVLVKCKAVKNYFTFE